MSAWHQYSLLREKMTPTKVAWKQKTDEKPKQWEYYAGVRSEFLDNTWMSSNDPREQEEGPWEWESEESAFVNGDRRISAASAETQGWQLINGWLVREVKE